ncbi:SDR family oxidoreductase [Rhodococcus koreensis]|uniref:SDR family oxidoreductase n=1 Tax=Rhodococcus sp. T2V TaxID=3034164 RepID=UPI0023E0D65E|nr:SDR family oxidoreductase [Rhodococcus sp. T2V]MDF3312865.1 SDR family oxidoreductase [Rhodococcus sp. T2V]
MSGDLTGKTAVVTGAARGIGRACAIAFAADGADLMLVDITRNLPGVPYPLGSRSQLDYTAELCREHGVSVLTQAVDVRALNEIRTAVDATHERFGRVDVLLNNAGIVAPSGKLAHEIGEDEWQLMIDVDLSGAWRAIAATGRIMMTQRSGSIINVASTAGLVGYSRFAGYVAAKHGVVGLTKAVALDYAPSGVRVNALCPGSVRDSPEFEGRMLSEIARSLGIDVAEHESVFVQAQPTNALIEPEDVAAAARWLASDDARHVTGTVVTVDGGFTAR